MRDAHPDSEQRAPVPDPPGAVSNQNAEEAEAEHGSGPEAHTDQERGGEAPEDQPA